MVAKTHYSILVACVKGNEVLVDQPRVDMLRVDRLLQPRQLLTQVGRPLEQPLEQPLEPAVEVLHTAVVLWIPGGMNTGSTPKRRHSRITRDRVRAAGPQPASSRALSSWTWAGRSRSFQHWCKNLRTRQPAIQAG